MILHDALPVIPWMDPRLNRLPGILPMVAGDWLRVDEVFAQQMALRARLMVDRRESVHALLPHADQAARELLAMVLEQLGPGYAVAKGQVRRPDGTTVSIDLDNPLITLGHLIQEDMCILQDDGQEYRLTGAILCFPASWTLAEKLGRPMMAIHGPVAHYTDDMGARVHRMLSMLRPEQGLWRMNYLTYESPDLHHPRSENDPRPRPPQERRHFLRAERQCLIRLPKTRAVAFSIHTYLMRLTDLPPEARAGLIG